MITQELDHIVSILLEANNYNVDKATTDYHNMLAVEPCYDGDLTVELYLATKEQLKIKIERERNQSKYNQPATLANTIIGISVLTGFLGSLLLIILRSVLS